MQALSLLCNKMRTCLKQELEIKHCSEQSGSLKLKTGVYSDLQQFYIDSQKFTNPCSITRILWCKNDTINQLKTCSTFTVLHMLYSSFERICKAEKFKEVKSPILNKWMVLSTFWFIYNSYGESIISPKIMLRDLRRFFPTVDCKKIKNQSYKCTAALIIKWHTIYEDTCAEKVHIFSKCFKQYIPHIPQWKLNNNKNWNASEKENDSNCMCNSVYTI